MYRRLAYALTIAFLVVACGTAPQTVARDDLETACKEARSEHRAFIWSCSQTTCLAQDAQKATATRATVDQECVKPDTEQRRTFVKKLRDDLFLTGRRK
jgi:hypothetical protein